MSSNGQPKSTTATAYLTVRNTTSAREKQFKRYTAKIVNVTQNQPNLNEGEFAVKINIEIPHTVLDVPMPEATVTLPPPDLASIPNVTVEPVNLDLSKAKR